MTRLCLTLLFSSTLAAADAPPGMDALTTGLSAPTTAPLGDFILPIANDLRFGYSTNIGTYRRTQGPDGSQEGGYLEHGLWVSYVRALTSPGRVLSGRPEWRMELGVLTSRAEVDNSNDSTGLLRSTMIDLGIGPAWTIAHDGRERWEIEVMPFVGIGRASYSNDYASEQAEIAGDTTIDASGNCVEYGIKANVMLCWASGWGLALHAGLLQRRCSLEGSSDTAWDNGTMNTADYTSDDTLTGARFGLFLARRF